MIEFSRMTPGAETNAAHIESLHATHNSVTGAVEDFRSLLRQGIQALGLVKLAASLVLFLVFALVAKQLFEGIGGLFPSRTPSQQVQPVKTLATVSPKQAPKANGSLMCGYSEDTLRCSCYDSKGGKVTIDFDECKALADNGTGVIRR